MRVCTRMHVSTLNLKTSPNSQLHLPKQQIITIENQMDGRSRSIENRRQVKLRERTTPTNFSSLSPSCYCTDIPLGLYLVLR